MPNWNIFFADFQRLEREFGLPAKFSEQLLESDHWSVVVKCHALVESTLNFGLSSRADAALRALLTDLPLHGKTSKLRAARELGLSSRHAEHFVRWLSQVRNRCVHDVRHLSLDLSVLLAEMKPSDRVALAAAMANAALGTSEEEADDPRLGEAAEGLLTAAPVAAIVLTTFAIMTHTLFATDPETVAKADAKRIAFLAAVSEPLERLKGVLASAASRQVASVEPPRKTPRGAA